MLLPIRPLSVSYVAGKVGEDIKIHDCSLKQKCSSVQLQCISHSIYVSFSLLVNMGAAGSEF